MQRQHHPHRPKSHTTVSNGKRGALGDTAGRVPPAWRSTAQPAGLRDGGQRAGPNGATTTAPRREHPHKPRPSSVGSKIFMSQLPPDVQEAEIEELFRETIGPVFDVFIVHNSQGRSKGMAVVNFQRPGDAVEARKKFNGKFIDGSRPLKIEIISDPPEKEKTLAERLGGALPIGATKNNRLLKLDQATPQETPAKRRPHWRNFKKGPRRLKKSVEQLDREMEAYRSEAAHFSDSAALHSKIDEVMAM